MVLAVVSMILRKTAGMVPLLLASSSSSAYEAAPVNQHRSKSFGVPKSNF